MIKCVFFDLSGVLFEGTRVIPGAVEAVNKAQASHLDVRFVTNTSRMNRRQLLAGLRDMGFNIHSEQLFTAPDAAKALIRANGWRPYCLLHKNLEEDFSDIDQTAPDTVIIGDAADGFCYERLDRAFRLCQAGARLIGLGRNRYFKLDGQLHLDAGPFIGAIEYAASCKAIITGKPSCDFFAQVIVSVNAEADEILMVGDDVFGDIQGALQSGMQACLVKTGKYHDGDEDLISGRFACVDSICEAIALALGNDPSNKER